MTKYFLDEEKIISGHFDNGQIEHYTKELGSRLKAVIYLWAFNNFHTNRNEVSKDLGRPMYRNLAEKLSGILCKDDMQAEIDRLRAALKSVKQQTINLGDYEEIGAIATISDICDKVLNKESEER